MITSMAHQRKQCTYFAKSLICIQNHQKHDNRKLVQLFDCATSTPELFVCNECSFSSNYTLDLKKHAAIHDTNKNSKAKYECKYYNLKTSSWSKHSTNEDPLYPELKVYKCTARISQRIGQNITTQPKKKKSVSVKYKTVCEDGAEWYECVYCPFKTFNKRSFYTHYSRFHKTKPEDQRFFYCDQCTFKTKLGCNLQTHIIHKHTDDKDVNWLKCNICSYKCKFKGLLTAHMIHKHKCSQSLRKFPHGFRKGVKNQRAAKLSLAAKKITQCEKCSFKSEYYKVKRHMKRVHTEEKENKCFKCEVCPYQTENQKFLNKHVRLIHASGKDSTWHPCKKCPLKFKTKVSHRMHMLHTHQSYDSLFKPESPQQPTNEDVKQGAKANAKRGGKKSKLVNCQLCPFKTMLETTLQTHLAVYHNGEVHTSVYAEALNVDQHKIVSNFQESKEIIWMFCDQCTYKTTKQRHLDRHVLVHTEGKDGELFTCGKCSFSTEDKVLYMSHHNLHTGDIFYCVLCPFTTWYRTNLTRHLTKKHPNCSLEELPSSES